MFHRIFDRPETAGERVKQFLSRVMIVLAIVGIYTAYKGLIWLVGLDGLTQTRLKPDPLFWPRVWAWGLIIAAIFTGILAAVEFYASMLRGKERELVREIYHEGAEADPEDRKPVQVWNEINQDNQSQLHEIRSLHQLTPAETLQFFEYNKPRTIEECKRLIKDYKGEKWKQVRGKLFAIQAKISAEENRQIRRAQHQKPEARPSPIIELSPNGGDGTGTGTGGTGVLPRQ